MNIGCVSTICWSPFYIELRRKTYSLFNIDDMKEEHSYEGRTVTMWDAEVILLKVNDSLCVWGGEQSCLILCDLMNCSQPCSSVHGISQGRIQEQVAISSSRGSNPCLLHLLHWQVHSLESYKMLLLLPSMLHKCKWSWSFGLKKETCVSPQWKSQERCIPTLPCGSPQHWYY